MPFDEKGPFVAKKEKHGDAGPPADQQPGDNGDHGAFDPQHRLVVSGVPGNRTEEKTHPLVRDVRERTGGRLMNRMTSDEYPVYKTATFEAYAVEQEQPRTGRPGRPRKPKRFLPRKLKYATAPKERENGRGVKVTTRVVVGTVLAVLAARAVSLVSKGVNTAFVGRHNGSDRNRNRRKVRKTGCSSKDWQGQEAMTCFPMYRYNFCWPVRTVRKKVGRKKYQPRTPGVRSGAHGSHRDDPSVGELPGQKAY